MEDTIYFFGQNAAPIPNFSTVWFKSPSCSNAPSVYFPVAALWIELQRA
ncbi:MAG: hypothetical protein KIY12_06695 [Thermoplasmata archaeon]|uniref:Uncharacterized protein n=1 Tax=Candidatus Sysuiplasma superficiale TaxID=2823368 RepID=A0A8J7YP98_9ARCH|nr:hypothetical protein [Candidatus Sysuiplasma superficiale]MBX8644390.1 hypothetical protein [Candidatus Sysuiplasma superficiale]